MFCVRLRSGGARSGLPVSSVLEPAVEITQRGLRSPRSVAQLNLSFSTRCRRIWMCI